MADATCPRNSIDSRGPRQIDRFDAIKLTSVRLAQRAHIVLLAADGLKNKDIAAQVGVGRNLVTRWRERYVQLGLAGIERDLPRGARRGRSMSLAWSN